MHVGTWALGTFSIGTSRAVTVSLRDIMFAGYVHKRTTPFSPPPMQVRSPLYRPIVSLCDRPFTLLPASQRVFSVLWGTLMMDYETEDEAKISLAPRTACEVLGISEWDGNGRGNQVGRGQYPT